VADVLRRVFVVTVTPAAVVPSTVDVWTNVLWDCLAVVVVVLAFCTADDAFCVVFNSTVRACSVGDACS
jgi:hypothetical protein